MLYNVNIEINFLWFGTFQTIGANKKTINDAVSRNLNLRNENRIIEI